MAIAKQDQQKAAKGKRAKALKADLPALTGFVKIKDEWTEYGKKEASKAIRELTFSSLEQNLFGQMKKDRLDLVTIDTVFCWFYAQLEKAEAIYFISRGGFTARFGYLGARTGRGLKIKVWFYLDRDDGSFLASMGVMMGAKGAVTESSSSSLLLEGRQHLLA